MNFLIPSSKSWKEEKSPTKHLNPYVVCLRRADILPPISQTLALILCFFTISARLVESFLTSHTKLNMAESPLTYRVALPIPPGGGIVILKVVVPTLFLAIPVLPRKFGGYNLSIV